MNKCFRAQISFPARLERRPGRSSTGVAVGMVCFVLGRLEEGCWGEELEGAEICVGGLEICVGIWGGFFEG